MSQSKNRFRLRPFYDRNDKTLCWLALRTPLLLNVNYIWLMSGVLLSIIEYCSPMWSPSHLKDIIKLERVQHQASKLILNNYVSLYHERCTAISILPLCFRQEIIDLCFLYSYLHGKLSGDYSSNFELLVRMIDSDLLNRVWYSN